MHIPFAVSERSTIGIEWELALVDSDSGDLRQVAMTVLDAVRPADAAEHPSIKQELLLNTVEVVSSVGRNVREAGADLQRAIDEIRAVTDPLRVELMCAGTHPFARWDHQKMTNKARYQTLIDRTQWWGRQMLIYGVHVHVGIEDRDKVLPISSAMLSYYGHLQALSASSPFWGGEDTGYASNRALMFQQLPTAGLPFQFQRWSEFEAYAADLLKTGVIDQLDEIRWDLRPSPKFGTLEVRVCDGIPTLDEVHEHLSPHPLPGRALLERARRGTHPAEPAALVLAGEQVAIGPLWHGFDPHPQRAGRRGPGHHRPQAAAGPARAGCRAARLPR